MRMVSERAARYLLVNTALNGANAIYLTYDRTVNKLYLNNDAGTGRWRVHAGDVAP